MLDQAAKNRFLLDLDKLDFALLLDEIGISDWATFRFDHVAGDVIPVTELDDPPRRLLGAGHFDFADEGQGSEERAQVGGEIVEGGRRCRSVRFDGSVGLDAVFFNAGHGAARSEKSGAKTADADDGENDEGHDDEEVMPFHSGKLSRVVAKVE